MKEARASLETLRPNRPLFVREWLLGVDETCPVSQEPTPDLQLMLVHGSCATEKQYHLMLLSLEAKVLAFHRKIAIRCILFDAVGCGQSPVLTDFSDYAPDAMIQDMQAVAQKFLDASVPTIWVGHSYGPSLMLRLLAQNRDELAEHAAAGLVLISTAVQPVPTADSSLLLPDGGPSIFVLPVWLLQCLQYLMTVQFTNMAIHPKHTWLRQACLADSNANSCFMVRSFYRQTKWATTEELVRVATPSVPVLVIHGVDDGILPIEHGQYIVNTVPNGTLCAVSEASHLVMLEQADKVATIVLDYLTKHFLNS